MSQRALDDPPRFGIVSRAWMLAPSRLLGQPAGCPALVGAALLALLFASENEGGRGLIARGVVTAAKALARRPGAARQTPRVSITIRRTALAKRRLGRDELKRFSDWGDGRPETELNFKFYRQATNKIVGISAAAAAFLRGFFLARPTARRRQGATVGTRSRKRS